jgi:hypothetical protein
MNTVASANRLDTPGMTPPAIEPAQHTAAKVVRFLYLFQMATAILGNPMCAIN